MGSPRWHQWCVVAIVCGLAARIVLAVVMTTTPDLFEFGIIGQNLATGRGYSFFAAFDDGVRPSTVGDPLPSAFRGPGYAYLVAANLEAAERVGVGFSRLLGATHVVLSALTLLAVHRVVTSLRAGPAALTATAVAAIYPPLVVLPSLGSSANLDQLALLLVAVTVLKVLERPDARSALVLSGAVVALWLCRPEAPAFVLAAVAAAGLAARSWKVIVAGATRDSPMR
jgi:hypothetical protein